MNSQTEKPTFKEALKFWIMLGFISFGRPAGQISIMHEFLVDKKKWISERKFLHALNYCMLLPGPLIMVLVFVGIMAGYNHCNNFFDEYFTRRNKLHYTVLDNHFICCSVSIQNWYDNLDLH